MSARETQFAGFAKQLLKKMLGDSGYIDFHADDTHYLEVYEEIIAQGAYDLAKYVVGVLPHLLKVAEQAQTVEEVLGYIPDLTVLPEPAEDASPMTCAVCQAVYVEGAHGWYGCQDTRGAKPETFAFCSEAHMQQWKQEHDKA